VVHDNAELGREDDVEPTSRVSRLGCE